MIFIGENIHIISKQVRYALENRDENFVKNLVKLQDNCDAIDLNIGPAKGKLDNIIEWLVPLVGDKNISFDTTNLSVIEQGLGLAKNPDKCFINSTSADIERLEGVCSLGLKHNCNIIALAMNKETGIPHSADIRMELIFQIYEYCSNNGINPAKLFIDPLVLPVTVDAAQGVEVLNTITMVKESFENEVQTIIGLSNISNGIAKNHRAVFNRVFAAMAYGAGLDTVIADANDRELMKIFEMLKCNNPKSDVDKLYINLSNMVQCFGELEDVIYDKNDKQQCILIKAAEILLNKKVYSESFMEI